MSDKTDVTPATPAGPMAIESYHSKRFDILSAAMAMDKRACIMTVTEKATGKKVHLICVVRDAKHAEGMVDIAPIARMLEPNEHDLYQPPE